VTGLPLLLDLAGRRVLVVGGGAVATRRAERLAESGAVIDVVAPQVSDRLRALAVRVADRPFAAGDVDGAWLVLACTDSPSVNAAVADAATEARTPAVARSGDVTVAVSGGDDPRRAMALRDAIEAALDLGELPLRAHRPAAAGSVALVGGGPGDPELITVRGRRLVASAEVIVVDRLAPRGLLTGLPPEVEVIDCGKSAHRHNLSQDEINAVLIDRARAGKRVVRLKGGDPFVFGRGGEEWLACLEAGVPVTVVPGVTSALAGPVVAGIPLTHRGLAADFTVVSGHLDPGRPPDTGLDWDALARASTLVLLMAMERLDLIVKALMSHGRDPATPTAVIEQATLGAQRVLRAPLHRLADDVTAHGLGAPAVVVIGDVVNALSTQ
jgi:uroporphyrin-III C-methyltransferase/precorrin-2 dehydrogenase/sirohydrochlorin ferrochelatase